MFSLAFYAFLRIGEIAIQTVAYANPHLLMLHEIQIQLCWVSNQQQLEPEFADLINIDETRDANYWPFRGLAHQHVLPATHASSITCFQTSMQ